MNWFMNVLKTLGPRIIGVTASTLTGVVYSKSKGTVLLDPGAVTGLVTGMLVTYAAAHRAASAVINPGDAAKGRVADGIKTAADNPQASDAVIIPPKQ